MSAAELQFLQPWLLALGGRENKKLHIILNHEVFLSMIKISWSIAIIISPNARVNNNSAKSGRFSTKWELNHIDYKNSCPKLDNGMVF